MYLECPNGCADKQFCSEAIVTQVWLCNNAGEFIDIAEDLTTVVTPPNKNDEWWCADCGKDAIVRGG